jgi:DNA-binding transcriptional LysR family regulator
MAGTPTLDQLGVLAAVVDSGSFSAAGRRLNRTQSVVSYTIATLEAQLGLRLFARGHRRPVLTEAGRAVLSDARRVLGTMEELRSRAGALTRGLEAELAVAVDVMFPTERLVGAIEDFAREFPTVALRLNIEALGGVAQLVIDRACGLGISGWTGSWIEGLWRRDIGATIMLPVAAPSHPLARLAGPLRAATLREHTQLVLSDRSKLTEGQDFGVLSPRTWRLGDLGAKHALLRAGLGWGNMPEPTIREDLRTGGLVRLDLEEGIQLPFPLRLIRRADTPPGPAAHWLAERIAASSASTFGDAVATPAPAA